MATVVRRFDRSELSRPVKTDAGFLRAEAYLTRVGVFEYVQPDGSVRRELRPPEEVFRDDSLDTLKAVPLTLEHPDEPVTSKNVRDLAVGTIGTDIWPERAYVRGTVVVMDEAAIKAAESGQKKELSCGYNCELEMTAGEWEGQRFDAIQRNIRYNHVALVEAGRAGPDVGLRLDSQDAVARHPYRTDSKPASGRKEKPMAVIRIDSVDYEAPDQTAQAVRAKLDSFQKRLDEAEQEKEKLDEELEKLKAERDQLEEELKKKKAEDEEEEKKRADSIRQAVRARIALETQARPILGEEFKFDDATDLEIKKAVIQKLSPEAKLDGKSEVYIEARYDAAIDLAKDAPNESLAKLRARLDSSTTGGGSTAQERRDEMIQKSRELWKEPILGGKGAA